MACFLTHGVYAYVHFFQKGIQHVLIDACDLRLSAKNHWTSSLIITGTRFPTWCQCSMVTSQQSTVMKIRSRQALYVFFVEWLKSMRARDIHVIQYFSGRPQNGYLFTQL